jgi:hypothetical protein
MEHMFKRLKWWSGALLCIISLHYKDGRIEMPVGRLYFLQDVLAETKGKDILKVH